MIKYKTRYHEIDDLFESYNNHSATLFNDHFTYGTWSPLFLSSGVSSPALSFYSIPSQTSIQQLTLFAVSVI